MENVCAELKQRVVEEKQRRKAMSREEKQAFREHKHEISSRVYNDKEKNQHVIREALKEWAECAILVWDTRTPPSSIFELEAAAELPYSMKKWLH
jgi:hypothetical protein